LASCYEDASNTWGLNISRQVTEKLLLKTADIIGREEKGTVLMN